MKIFFDFDYTLFDTARFKLAFQKSFEELGVSKELFLQTYSDSKREQIYSPQIQFTLIAKNKPCIPLYRMKKELKGLLKESSDFLYPDTLSFLKRWYRKLDLFILSSGQKGFQREKIKNSGTEDFLKKIFITQNLRKTPFLKRILKTKERALFIDDDLKVLYDVKINVPNLITIRLNRKEGKHSKLPNIPQIDFSIKDLGTLRKIISVINKDA